MEGYRLGCRWICRGEVYALALRVYSERMTLWKRIGETDGADLLLGSCLTALVLAVILTGVIGFGWAAGLWVGAVCTMAVLRTVVGAFKMLWKWWNAVDV